MPSYENIRLETPGGDVIVYLAPSFEVVPQDQNDEFSSPRSNGTAVVRDNGLWTSELTVQGSFVHSNIAGPEFKAELQDMFNQELVSPDDQINRLRSYTVYGDEDGALHFYHRDNEYTALTDDDVDIENGVYPAVVATELRTPEEGETSTNQADFLVRLAIGVER